MNLWELPTTMTVGNKTWKIRTDFRVIIDILSNFNNPEYEGDEKAFICLDSFYEGFCDYLEDGTVVTHMPQEDCKEALKKAIEFIDMGIQDDGKRQAHTMDWEQDAPLIIPAVNKVMGKEIRSLPYMHWWTFMGAYMEIGESLFSEVINIRSKKAKGKKLEKWEKDFYKENKAMVDLKVKYTEEELEEQQRLQALLGL